MINPTGVAVQLIYELRELAECGQMLGTPALAALSEQ